MTRGHLRALAAVVAALATLVVAVQFLVIEPTVAAAQRSATAGAAREAALAAALGDQGLPLPAGAEAAPAGTPPPAGVGVAATADGRVVWVQPSADGGLAVALRGRMALVTAAGVLTVMGWMLWAGLGRRRERGREARRRIETVGMVVHDLRGPLTGIALAAERLRRDCPPPVRERACAAIDRECGRLGGIVDDLLTLCTERAATSPERAPDSVADVLDDVAERLRTREGCTVVVEADPLLRGLPADGQLTRAVGNVAENAARHAAERVRICARRSAEGLEIVIDDDGEGFAPGFAPTAFHRGVAGGSAGLGLTSARRAVERLGGSLRLGHRTGGGAAISLRVPLRGAPR